MKPVTLLLFVAAFSGNLLGSFTQSPDLSSVIRELNAALKLEWNAFIALETSDELDQVLQNIDIPTMLITDLKGVTSEIHKNHRHQFMVIAFVKGSSNSSADSDESDEWKVEMLVKAFLRHIHYTHILWIYHQASRQYLELAALQHWSHGFMNCLLYTNASLYSYDPVPQVKVIPLANATEYSTHKEIRNFHGYPLSFPIISAAPRCYRYTNRQGQMVYAGIFYKILHIFMDVYNFTFTEYPYSYGSYNRSGIVNAILSGEIDIHPNSYYKTYVLPRSDVLMNNEIYILVPSAKPVKQEMYYYLPFKPIVWWLHTFTYLLASCVLVLITYAQRRHTYFDSSKPFFYVCNVFMNQACFGIPTKMTLRKLFLFSIMAYGFLITNVYLARLSSTLVSNIYETKIETFHQFSQTNLRLVVTNSEYGYLHKLPDIPNDILQRLQMTKSRLVHNYMWSLNHTQAYVAADDTIDFILFQQMFLKYPLMHKIKSFLYSAQLFFTVRDNVPYLKIFNRFLHNVSASGLLRKIMLESNLEGILSGEIRFLCDDHARMGTKALGIGYFVHPFKILYSGLLTSLLVFLCEMAKGRRWRIKLRR